MRRSEFDYKIVKDPRIFQENRIDPHSDHEYYDSEAYGYGDRSNFKYLLNGCLSILIREVSVKAVIVAVLGIL